MSEPRRGREGGRALLSLLAALGALATLVGLAPSLLPAARRRHTLGAARTLAAAVRGQSLAARLDGRARALVFPAAADADLPIVLARDTSGDGVSRAGLRAGEDRRTGWLALGAEHGEAGIGVPSWTGAPAPPPGRGLLDPTSDPVRLGTERVLVLTPEGHATPGSVMLTDGRERVCRVVVHGGTGRVRVHCLDRREGRWRER